MHQLARILSRFGRFDRPVVDRTGLSEDFDFFALVSADMPGATGDVRFLLALREQLGLTLRSEQGAFDVLTFGAFSRPSPN